MKKQATLAVVVLAAALGSYSASAQDAAENSAADADSALQAQGVDAAASALSADEADTMDADNFVGHGPAPHPSPAFHPAPAPIFHPVPHPAPVFHPTPVFHPPVQFHGGNYPWRHWDHPVFARPAFAWNWAVLRVVTCTAENSSGYQFPVTENGFYGIAYQARVAQIEDAAIDRCYSETNGDESCQLVGCTPGY